MLVEQEQCAVNQLKFWSQQTGSGWPDCFGAKENREMSFDFFSRAERLSIHVLIPFVLPGSPGTGTVL